MTLSPPGKEELLDLNLLLAEIKNYPPSTHQKGAALINARCVVRQNSPWFQTLSQTYTVDMMRRLLDLPQEFDVWLANPSTPGSTYKAMSHVFVQGFLSPQYRGTDNSIVKMLGKISQAYPEAIKSTCTPEFFARLSQNTLHNTDEEVALGVAAIRRARLGQIAPASPGLSNPKTGPSI